MEFFEYLFFGVSTDEHSHGSSDFGNRRERRALLKTKNKGFYIENDYRYLRKILLKMRFFLLLLVVSQKETLPTATIQISYSV